MQSPLAAASDGEQSQPVGPTTKCPNHHAALSNTLSLLKYAIPLVSIVACCYFDAGQPDVQQALCLVGASWPVG
jgi:hypothetical protein